MEVAITSRESIKPALHLDHLQHYQLSLLDQLTPTTYSPLILFYPISDARQTRSAQISRQLKWSLSKTLNPFHPLSGRVKDNLFVHDYGAGVPYAETRVKLHLYDFLQNPQLESLNKFLPCQPFCQQADLNVPQLAVQFNVFDCGGVALGLCFSHKINDGITGSALLKTWAANAKGSLGKVVHPNLSDASSLFPPQDSIPTQYKSLVKNFWFSENSYATRRFVFDANAVAALRAKARSKFVEYPTRAQALCAFIWKCAMKASRSMSGFPRPSFLAQSVNLRALTRPRLSKHSIGNLIWFATAECKPAETDMEMGDLAAIIKDSVEGINSEFLKSLSGDGGSGAIFDQLNRLVDMSKGNSDTFTFSSWHTFGLNDIDFGWGKPIWTALFGETSPDSPTDSNFMVLKDTARNNEIEAWMTLDENIVPALERDPEFLAYASPNPSILGATLLEPSRVLV